MSQHPSQMALSIALDRQCTLNNFYSPEGSIFEQATSILRGPLVNGQEPFVYLWGSAGSGVTHLLQGACHELLAVGKSVQYLPLDEVLEYPPQALFDSLEQTDLVCLDNLQVVAGQGEWEEGLFHLFNGIKAQGNRLLVGANTSPVHMPVELPDLKSRLTWGLSLQLPTLADEQKVLLLQFCARQRGLELADAPAQYLLSRLPRDVSQLVAALDQLDKASLQTQRRLTIPFIRQALNL
ncbi:DnaA regulatory inactivator Hda [Porticoccus sp. W117]|uniref:DnaA regulatory inactivator Hda n=1 Tax=Porticoccus sp. W117 TaxID=3054777 RepID=UPI002594F95B|nr:DnaA regulatory inactivator Hda [Porticoccus sp. W117]MDM3870084.1 DnaA regulatory inactivator Hda [Porticoccus sp. W117]